MIDFTKASKKTGQLERQYIAEMRDAYQGAYDDVEKQIKAIYSDPKNLDANGNLKGAAILREKRFIATQNKIAGTLSSIEGTVAKTVNDAVKETYKVNFDYGAESLGTLETGIDFGMINREAVLKAATSPLALTAIEENKDAVLAAVKKSIISSVVSGASIDTMASRIQKDLQTNANNAVRIARTETTRVMGEARNELLQQAQDLGLHVIKVWIATNDDRTRESHVHINGEEREMDQPFSNGLMFPGDTSTGDPGETINCRCAMAAKTIPTEAQKKESNDPFSNVTIKSTERNIDAQMKAEYDAWKAAKALSKNNVAQVSRPAANISDYTPLNSREIAANDKYIASLPSNQKNSISEYTGQRYRTINSDLRTGAESQQYIKDIIADMDAAFRNAPALQTNTTVARRISTQNLDDLFGPGTFDLFEEASMLNSNNYNPASYELLKKRLIGTSMTDAGFVSTTNSTRVGSMSTFKFTLPKGYNNGIYVPKISHFPAEEEFLLNRGQTFVVRDIIHNEGTGLLQFILGPKP